MTDQLLLDTHTLLWWAADRSQLSSKANDAIEDGGNDVYVSPVSAMEIATKVRIRKLDFGQSLARNFRRQMAERGFLELVLTYEHSELAGSFEADHNDPWDRLLAAQAQIEGLKLVTNDSKICRFGVETYW